MMGGWALRLSDLKVAISAGTGTLRYENQQLARLLNLCREVKDHMENIKTKAEETATTVVRGKPRMAMLPQRDVEDFAMKIHDLKDQLAFMCKTHQFPFNGQLDEYIKRHMSDCNMYTESEEQSLKIERKVKAGDQRGWLIHQCESNMVELNEARIQLDSMRVLFHERNKIVLQNEGFIIHILHHVAKVIDSADNFIKIYHLEVPPT